MKAEKIVKSLFLSSLILLSSLFCVSCSGGSATGVGPLSIPAPTTSNIRVTSPNADGLVRVDGSAGAVESSHRVEITNVTDASVTAVTTTADEEGAFSAAIRAAIGDSLSLVAIHPTTDDRSDAVQLSVPENMIPFDFNPRDVVTDNSGRAYVVGMEGDQALVATIDLESQSILSSFEVDLTNPRQISLDDTTDRLLITDPTDNVVLVVGIEDPAADENRVAISGATSLDVDVDLRRGWVGTNNATASVVVFSLDTFTVLATQAMTNADNAGATYEETGALDVDDSGIAMLVSDFSDGTSQITSVSTDNESILVNSRRVFAGSSFADIVSLNTASVVVADSANDRLLIVDPTGNTATVEIAAGETPAGLVENAAGNQVVVSNRNEHTASVVDLTTSTLLETFEVGLAPGGVGLDQTTGKALVLGTENESLTLIDFENP